MKRTKFVSWSGDLRRWKAGSDGKNDRLRSWKGRWWKMERLWMRSKRRANGGQGGHSEGELKAVVGWSWCPRRIQVRLPAPGHSVSNYSAWQIHRQDVKMKSFESNLQDNGLLHRPEVDQWRAGPGRPERERHFPSSSARDGATCD